MTWSEVRAHFLSFQKGHKQIARYMMYHGSMMESIGSYILIIIAIISIWRHLGYGDTSSQFHVLCDPGFWIVSQAVASFELTSNQHWFFDDEIFEMYLSRVQIIRR